MPSMSQHRSAAEQSAPGLPPTSRQGSVVAFHAHRRTPFDDRTLDSQVLDHLQVAIAVVTGVGRVRFANPAMRALTDAGRCAGIAPSGRLYFTDRGVQAAFDAAVADPRGGVAFAVKDGDGEIRHLASLQPLPDAAEPSILIVFCDVRTDASQAECLMRTFGLTPAEQRLAGFLVAGGRLMDAARNFALSPHTVRNQLRTIFAKTGARRQADLTRLLCRS